MSKSKVVSDHVECDFSDEVGMIPEIPQSTIS